MPKPFIATRPFKNDQFPGAERPFPITEVFGYDRTLPTPEAIDAFNNRHCPFANNACEKFQQYGYGYCSVQYRSKYDAQPQVYAVCDHRLDGPPVWHAIEEHFGKAAPDVVLVPELKLTNPDQSFDYIALNPKTDEFIAVETQAIDIRGGGVGPAWLGIELGRPQDWRSLYSSEAKKKGRKDDIAYGVNMANITKRLGLQVGEKASLLKGISAKLYVVAQDRCFDYFQSRIRADWTGERHGDWDITFVTFDFTGAVLPNGMWEVVYKRSARTNYKSFSEALVRSTATVSRQDFLQRVREKAGL